jgi:hypothetical protein
MILWPYFRNEFLGDVRAAMWESSFAKEQCSHIPMFLVNIHVHRIL